MTTAFKPATNRHAEPAMRPITKKHRTTRPPAGSVPTAQSLAGLQDVLDNSPGAQSLAGLKGVLGNSPAVQRLQASGRALQSADAAAIRPSDVGQRVAKTAPANKTGLPDALKSGIEALSGVSLDSVRVHRNSTRPAQLGALAFAQGNQIHLAAGQERHLPHEAWHVAQQAQGRVGPTMQMKGVSINDDKGLEAEADRMGAKALQLAAATDRAPDATGLAGPAAFAGSGGNVVQRLLAPGFGDSEYRAAATKNLELERKIGSALIADGRVTDIARRIRAYSGAPIESAELTDEDRAHLAGAVGPIGGGRDLHEGKETLDAHVLATHLKLDRSENNDPDAPVGTKRKNKFNRVASEHNPIYPWNAHPFDDDLFKVRNWDDYPEEIQHLLIERWDAYRHDELVQARVMSFPSLVNTTGLAARPVDFIIAALTTDEQRKTFLYDILNIPWSTSQSKPDAAGPGDDNPLGPAFRQHHTGNYANVVSGADAGDPIINDWVQKAIAHKKPIISGPSGHSLRYLNHWAHVLTGFGERAPEMPTLAEARLVMMANLMPPKNHHSYHEIMLASIGISALGETLGYAHPESYADLAGTAIGAHALQAATRSDRPNTEPLPNPWALQGVSRFETAKTPEVLIHKLALYATDRASAKLILQSTAKSVREHAVPIIRDYIDRGNIDQRDGEMVIGLIHELSVFRFKPDKTETGPSWGY